MFQREKTGYATCGMCSVEREDDSSSSIRYVNTSQNSLGKCEQPSRHDRAYVIVSISTTLAWKASDPAVMNVTTILQRGPNKVVSLV
jgi:hypothetical protein